MKERDKFPVLRDPGKQILSQELHKIVSVMTPESDGMPQEVGQGGSPKSCVAQTSFPRYGKQVHTRGI